MRKDEITKAIIKGTAKALAWTPAIVTMVMISESLGYSMKDGRIGMPQLVMASTTTATGTLVTGCILESTINGFVDKILEDSDENKK